VLPCVDVAHYDRRVHEHAPDNAQTIGDVNTLRGIGRTSRSAERVRLEGEDPVSALRSVTAQIKEQA
jgi:hypothetical protein